MPVVKGPSLGLKSSFAPYDMNHFSSRIERPPYVRSCDNGHGQDFPYGFDESSWVTGAPLPDPDFLDYPSVACPSNFSSSSSYSDSMSYGESPVFLLSRSITHRLLDETLEGGIFPWTLEGGSDYSASTVSDTAFSPSISVVSYSPRSDHSGLSLSPQPHPQDFSANPFGFDFNTATPEFPSSLSSSPWPQTSASSVATSRKSSMSHSPSPSTSSLVDVAESKPSRSRGASPSRSPKSSATETDAQQARRRFPCIVIGCERRFTSQYTLKVHVEAHKPKPRSSFPCTLGCSERFSRQHDRLRHEVAKHGKVCEFSCDDCGRFFSTKKTLGNHKCPVAQGGTRWVTN